MSLIGDLAPIIGPNGPCTLTDSGQLRFKCPKQTTTDTPPPCGPGCDRFGPGEGCLRYEWTDVPCEGFDGPCEAEVTRCVPCRTRYHYDAPERAASARLAYTWVRKLNCFGLQAVVKAQLEGLLVKLDAEMEKGNPNHSPHLCPECAAAYTEYWNDMWSDYYGAVMP